MNLERGVYLGLPGLLFQTGKISRGFRTLFLRFMILQLITPKTIYKKLLFRVFWFSQESNYFCQYLPESGEKLAKSTFHLACMWTGAGDKAWEARIRGLKSRAGKNFHWLQWEKDSWGPLFGLLSAMSIFLLKLCLCLGKTFFESQRSYLQLVFRRARLLSLLL